MKKDRFKYIRNYEYSYNKENCDYIEFSPVITIGCLLKRKDIDLDTKKILEQFYKKYLEYEDNKAVQRYESVSIPKESVLGNIITTRSDLFYCKEEEITYDKIINAFLVAQYSNDKEKIDSLLPYFREERKLLGLKRDLYIEEKEEVLNFILNNSNFKNYLNNRQETKEDPKVYVVYEGDTFIEKKLSSKVITKVKK